jgi:transcriptional regulator with XRE-family HTH domain
VRAGNVGNQALRQLRLRRFWTQADFASAFEARSRQIGRPLSLSVRQVRRWESDNPPLPLPAYQAVLEALFGVPIERMGFQPQWAREEADPPGAGADPVTDAEWARTAVGGFAADGGAGVTRSPQDDHERLDPVKRRQFMTSAVALGSGGLAAAVPGTAAGAVRTNRGQIAQTAVTNPCPTGEQTVRQAEAAGRLAEQGAAGSSATGVDPALVTGYSVITAQHRSLYWNVPASSMFTPVAAHSELGLGLLRAAGSPALRARLARPVAETALLAARLAFFDLQQPRLAEGYFAVALDAARESTDRALTGAVLAHMAFVPAFAGQARRARELMAQARRQSHGAIGAMQSSWMYAVESEVEARVGGGPLANDLIARSEGELGADTGSGGGVPEWLDFFDSSRLAGFKGYSQLATGRCGEAAVSLERTLRTLPASAAKQRSITLADLAQVRVQQGELEESARLLGGAIAQLHRSWYATGVDRVDGVRRRLAAVNAPVRVLAPVEEARHGLEAARP